MKTSKPTPINTKKLIASLRKTHKALSVEFHMLIDHLESDPTYENHDNLKKLRKYFDLIVNEIDKRKAMRGI